MPDLIVFSSSRRVAAPPAPTFSVAYSTQNIARDVVIDGFDTEAVVSIAASNASVATVTATEGSGPLAYAGSQPPQLFVDRQTGVVSKSHIATQLTVVSASALMEASLSGRVAVPVTVSASYSVTGAINRPKRGTVAEHIRNAIDALLIGKTPGVASQSIYSFNNYSNTAPAVVRNPDLFCGQYDWTGMSVVSWYGNNPPEPYSACPAHLISPIHALVARHFTINQPANWPYVFQGADGTLHIRRNVGYVDYMPNLFGSTPSDARMIVFDRPLPVEGPSRVTPFQLMPQGVERKFQPGVKTDLAGFSADAGYVPMFQRKRWAWQGNPGVMDTMHVAIGKFNMVTPSASPAGANVANNITPIMFGALGQVTISTPYGPWTTRLSQTVSVWDDGDSGSGLFVPIDGNLVLLGVASVPGGGVGFWEADGRVAAAMNALAPGYTPEWPKYADLSWFVIP